MVTVQEETDVSIDIVKRMYGWFKKEVICAERFAVQPLVLRHPDCVAKLQTATLYGESTPLWQT
jgi:hypothetical protein